MSDEKGSFWTSVPGILMGIAAVIGAITTLYLALNGGVGPLDDSNGATPTPTITPTSTPTITPTSTPTITPTSTPLLSISPDPLYLNFGTLSLSEGDVISRTFAITNAGVGTLEWFVAVDYSYRGLTITPKYNSELGYSGTNSGVVTVTIDANGLNELGFNPGKSLEEELFIKSNGGNKTGTYKWSLTY